MGMPIKQTAFQWNLTLELQHPESRIISSDYLPLLKLFATS